MTLPADLNQRYTVCIHVCAMHRDCRYPVQLIEDSDASMSNFDSVIDGLDLAAEIYDFHPEVPHLHRDWAHPATSAPGLGSPLRSTPRCRRSGP